MSQCLPVVLSVPSAPDQLPLRCTFPSPSLDRTEATNACPSKTSDGETRQPPSCALSFVMFLGSNGSLQAGTNWLKAGLDGPHSNPGQLHGS